MTRFTIILLLLSFCASGDILHAQDDPSKANVIFFSAGKLRDADLFDRTRQIVSGQGYEITGEDRDNLQLTAIPGNSEKTVDGVNVKLVLNVSGYTVALRTFLSNAESPGTWTRVANPGEKDSIREKIWTNSYHLAEKLRELIGGDITVRKEPL